MKLLKVMMIDCFDFIARNERRVAHLQCEALMKVMMIIWFPTLGNKRGMKFENPGSTCTPPPRRRWQHTSYTPACV